MYFTYAFILTCFVFFMIILKLILKKSYNIGIIILFFVLAFIAIASKISFYENIFVTIDPELEYSIYFSLSIGASIASIILGFSEHGYKAGKLVVKKTDKVLSEEKQENEDMDLEILDDKLTETTSLLAVDEQHFCVLEFAYKNALPSKEFKQELRENLKSLKSSYESIKTIHDLGSNKYAFVFEGDEMLTFAEEVANALLKYKFACDADSVISLKASIACTLDYPSINYKDLLYDCDKLINSVNDNDYIIYNHEKTSVNAILSKYGLSSDEDLSKFN